jgi:hypothetical protein
MDENMLKVGLFKCKNSELVAARAAAVRQVERIGTGRDSPHASLKYVIGLICRVNIISSLNKE